MRHTPNSLVRASHSPQLLAVDNSRQVDSAHNHKHNHSSQGHQRHTPLLLQGQHTVIDSHTCEQALPGRNKPRQQLPVVALRHSNSPTTSP